MQQIADQKQNVALGLASGAIVWLLLWTTLAEPLGMLLTPGAFVVAGAIGYFWLNSWTASTRAIALSTGVC